MDPLTQGALGAALPQAVRPNAQAAIAGALGFAAGMAADLDVLIRSSSDPPAAHSQRPLPLALRPILYPHVQAGHRRCEFAHSAAAPRPGRLAGSQTPPGRSSRI